MADAVFKPKFATGGIAVTITMDSLATSSTSVSGRSSVIIDNTVTRYDMIDVHVTAVVTGVGSIGTAPTLYLYAYGTILAADGTTDLYPSPVTSGDAAIVIEPDKLVYVGAMTLTAVGGTYKKIFKIAPAFSGSIPRKWGLIVINTCGLALAAAGNSIVFYGSNGEAVTT